MVKTSSSSMVEEALLPSAAVVNSLDFLDEDLGSPNLLKACAHSVIKLEAAATFLCIGDILFKKV